MEIIILPYMAVSFSIAWAVFSPFAELENVFEWTFARIETSDLFGVFLPTSLLLAVANSAAPTEKIPVWSSILVAAVIFLYASAGFVAGLFFLAKMKRLNAFKRMAVIGVVIPFGVLMTVAWIALPLFAFAKSILYAIPAIIAIVPLTLVLRWLSRWACDSNPA